MSEIPIAPVKRIVRNTGAERSTSSAVELLAESGEEWMTNIAMMARTYARHAGRATIQDKDIKMALKNY